MTIQELEQCITLYGKEIYSFCIHLTKTKELADDLYQDTFLEAMKKIHTIQFEQNPKSYLLSITIRLWKNQVRKNAWRNRIAPQVTQELHPEISDLEEDLFQKYTANEEKYALWKALGKLHDHFRIPLLLYYMDELSISDIAKILSIPPGTVKSRLYHGRKQLEKELGDFIL